MTDQQRIEEIRTELIEFDNLGRERWGIEVGELHNKIYRAGELVELLDEQLAQVTAERDELSGILSRTDKRAQLDAQAEMERKLAASERRESRLALALRHLRNESRGMLSVHETAIRADFGNTNWEVYQRRLREADEALADAQPPAPSAGTEGV